MPTLLLRLAGPLQSWGSSSKFERRTTEKMPTKSGVVGILAAALGLKRDADLTELRSLKFGVRADREGEVVTDFHTAHGKQPYLTYRHYLSDAVFLAGFEGDDKFLKKLEQALKSPAFPLFLGRRSCPPSFPIVVGIRENDLETALANEPMLCDGRNMDCLRIQIDTTDEYAGMVQDLPISFNPNKRLYGYRKVSEYFVPLPCDLYKNEHDPFSELE